MHDAIIIGAGPVGLAAGIAAKRAGLDILLIEKGGLVNSLIGYPTQMEFFSTPDLLEIGGYPFPCMGYKPTREEAIEYYRKVAQREQLPVRLYEAVESLSGEDGELTIHTSKGTYPTRKVIVSTGFFDVPNHIDVPGEDLPKVSHYFKEPYPYSGQRVVIVGAKNSAAKAALACYRQGADVTMIVRGPAISDSVKYWIKPDLENRIKDGNIRAFFNSTVTEITETTVRFESEEGPKEIGNDWVLLLTGYQPNFPLLTALGISFTKDRTRTPLFDAETFETSRAGVYLAGTVCGGLNTSKWFIENGREHADIIARHILNSLRDVQENVVAQ